MKGYGVFIACLASGLIGYKVGRREPASVTSETKLVVNTTQSSVEVRSVEDKKVQATNITAEEAPKKVASGSKPTIADEPNEVIEIEDVYAGPEAMELLRKHEIEGTTRYEKWKHERAEKGVVITKGDTAKDGSYYTQERLGNGQIADREYGSTGALRSEAMIEPDGNKISRSFFLNGQVKFLMFETKDGTRDMTSLDSSGFAINQTVEYANGTRLVFEYDESGNITRKVFIEKDKPGRIIE